jgi:hypothetical protein
MVTSDFIIWNQAIALYVNINTRPAAI